MTEKRFTKQEVYEGINRYRINESNFIVEILDDGIPMHYSTIVNRLNEQHKTITRLEKENGQLKEDLKTCRAWLNSDKYDYELTLAFIKNKGYSLKDVLEYEKELKSE